MFLQRFQLVRNFLVIATGVMCFTAVLPLAQASDEIANSGYLGDDKTYQQLQEIELRSGLKAKRWLGPGLNFANYQMVMIDTVQLYPEPQPGPQVSAEVLEQIRGHLTEGLRQKVGSVIKVVDEAGPNVLRVAAAVTGVSIKTEGMKVYEVLPIAAIFGGAKALTGKRDRDVKVFIEVKLTDSVTGETQGLVVREVQGEQLEGKKDQLSLEDMQASLDAATDDAKEYIASALQH